MSHVELRYNLATKVMRNGVEVIVATDRNHRPVEFEYLRHLSSTVTRPITLAPHTLTNLMSMVLPTEHDDDMQSHLMSFLQPSFITKTYYTKYSYPATIIKNNATAVSSVKTTVTNIKTEEKSRTRSTENVQPQSITLNSSPTFQTEVFHTAYTYWNTFLDGDQPIVMSSTHTLSNTLVGTFGADELEPSEVFPTTNTYLKTIEFKKTITDGTDFQVMSTKDLVTQVVVTDKPIRKAANGPITTDVTKTYFVTYTYFSTYLDGDQTKVKSDVSVSSDVTIEKFYIKPKKTETVTIQQTGKPEAVKYSIADYPLNIRATKTYFTTFTDDGDEARTEINSKTVENTIPLEDFNTDYLVQLNSSLNRITGSLVATATLKGGEKIKVTAHKTPELSSSYLKYEIKPTKTIEDEIYQTEKSSQEASKPKTTHSKSNLVLSKTKNTLQKSKIKMSKTIIREATAEALIATENEVNSFSTPTVTFTAATSNPPVENLATEAPSPTSTQIPAESTATSQEKVTKDESGETLEYSETNLTKKKPTIKQPNSHMNVSNLLNLNSLGINGINVLGPVFNAMAELIHNNLNKNADSFARRNDTVLSNKESEPVLKKPASSNVNPILSFVNKFTPAKGASEPKTKGSTPRTPVYIPVGSFAKDSEFGESQDSHVIANSPEKWRDKWPDTHSKNFEKVRPHDNPITILEGGIPISPGQVITTNSDVIIGRPGESGPRPPVFAIKNNIPIDMKPPPLPPPAFEDEDGFIAQHSTNQGVDFGRTQDEHKVKPSRPPLPPSKKHLPEPYKNLRPHPNDRFKGPPRHKNPHSGKIRYDSGTMDLNPPPVPPPPVRSHDVHRPITINHEQKEESDSHKTPNHILSIPLHQNVENYINPAEINPAPLGLPTIPAIIQEGVVPIINEPTPSINVVNPNNVLLIPPVAHIPLNFGATENSNLVDRSTGQQLLVNIQPSQVANIVIPHGSSTALILSDGKQHSLKGEVIDDPSPHPEPETVGFVGAEPVLKIENEDTPGTVHNDVVPAAAAEVSQHSTQGNRVPFANRPHLTTELIKIRPKPPKGQFSHGTVSEQNLHLPRPTIPVQFGNHNNEGYYEGQTGIHLNQNHNIQALNFVNDQTIKNHRNEGVNLNNGGVNLFTQVHDTVVPQIVPNEVQILQQQHLIDNSGVINRPNNPVRGGNGIYVDISPPGHLPPRPNPNVFLQSHLADKQQSTINEHLFHHQSGMVHDVPLNAQVQLGSGHNKENPLKEILISSNANKHDSIYESNTKVVEGKFPEGVIPSKRPLPDLPENLSPPPLSKDGSYRIHRPPFIPHPTVPGQRYPPHQTVPKPADFMVPPPQVSHRPNQKPPEHHPRPIIPIGAGSVHQDYPNPRPEDILIVPPKNRPGVSPVNYDIKQTLNSDLDVSDTSDPLKTEYGEEIQESISRPLFPGQLPVELQKWNSSHNKQNADIEVNQNSVSNSSGNHNVRPKPSSHKNPENLPSSPNHFLSNYPESGGSKKPTSTGQTSFFNFIKKPSGFVNQGETSSSSDRKETSSFANHKESSNLENHKLQSPHKTPIKTNVRIPAARPSVFASGFVKNQNAVDQKREPIRGHKPALHDNRRPDKDSTRFSSTTEVSSLKDKTTQSNKEETKDKTKVSTNTAPERQNFEESSNTISTQKLDQNVQIKQDDSSIKFDSNKISTGYPTTGVFKPGSTKPQRRPTEEPTVRPIKPPAGFTSFVKDTKPTSPTRDGVQTADVKKPPPKQANGNTQSVKIPSGFAYKNKTDHSFGAVSNHNYGNKTINFYDSKPQFNDEREVAYNKGEPDKWFSTNYGSDSNTKLKNKPTPTHRNVSSFPNKILPTDSGLHIPLLTPPKVGEGRPKPEDVMGLSPPPLERPRRPQNSHRPKPPFKFEIPTTPKTPLSPIAIENDFPPVRSPDFNRKPLKPQDIFPPKLPENFIHHIPEHPRPRPQDGPVTSLPIDTPESDSEKNNYHGHADENSGRDTFFSGSEINGHSKPIIDSEPVLTSMRPPPPPPNNNKVNVPPPHPRPSTVYQQPPKVKTTEKPKPESSTSKPKPLETSILEDFAPTSTLNVPVKTTFHTKVSASVTPTAVHSQKEWQLADIITGSETIFDPDKFSSYVTPSIHEFVTKKNIVTTLISTGSTTIFGDMYTSGPKKINKTTTTSALKEKERMTDVVVELPTEKTIITPTKTEMRTTTLTVTTTMTTVVHSIGHKPFTKTIVLTKTLISTVFNKITETKTLVKPTTATIIQTHTIATTKTALVVPTDLYPSQTKYPTGGTLKPEIFVADPHAKDTMTISVSTSMNKNKPGEDKRKPVGTNKDSIYVFVSNQHPDVGAPDNEDSNVDVISNEDGDANDSRVVVGGVFDATEFKETNQEVECSPGCKAKRNELCQKIDGVMKCVCRPGFARMFPDRPCRPTYTYNVQLTLEKLGSEQITHEKNVVQTASPNMAKLASATKEGLDRMIMQSDLRDIYHGLVVNGFQGKEKKTMVDFYVQLSENTDETKLMEILKKTLQTSNYSLGGTELFAAREAGGLYAEDFNECLNPKYHDCSEHARCFNLKGTYTCSCKEGFTDLSENAQFPGRVCSDTIGCEYCGYHGACYSKGEGQITCECFQWYSGERCHINLKVLLIALVTIGAILLALLLVCAIMTCINRSRSSTASRTNGSGYLRYRGPSTQSLDRRAMIGDSSSESSVDNLPYICSQTMPSAEKKKPALRHTKGPAPRPMPLTGMEQRDRSVTVMIPRAKYRPMPPLSPHLTMSTFSPDKHLSKTAAQIATEQKLINYLDGNARENKTLMSTIQNNRQAKEQQKNSEYKTPSPNINSSPKTEKKKDSKVFEYEYKISNMLFTEETNSTDKRSFKSLDDRFRRHSDSTHLNNDNSNRNQFRKYSAGALVSAGYEVSAKVGMHHLEEDTTEDEQSAIINTHTMKSSRSQFTTLNRTGDHKTMSEARSYDETTVHPPTRSLKTHYSGSSPSSRVNNDEGHTMIERDLGSTFIVPESQLFKPEADRGSDISNFDSL